MKVCYVTTDGTAFTAKSQIQKDFKSKSNTLCLQ